MSDMTITHIIGTDDVGIGSDEIDGIEAYRAEVAERLAEAFPDAAHIDVVIDNGGSKSRVTGLSLEEAIEREKEIIGEIDYIANEVWNSGNWHNA